MCHETEWMWPCQHKTDRFLQRRKVLRSRQAAEGTAQAAWRLLAAEAHLALGDAEAARPPASEALVLFKKHGVHGGEARPWGRRPRGGRWRRPGRWCGACW